MSEGSNDQQPPRVRKLEPGGQTTAQRSWVERAVWNERMLETLATGVTGGKWHSLMDKVYRLSNLKAAWESVAANQGAAGVDQVTLSEFSPNADERLQKLSEALREGSYKPLPVRRAYIPKPGTKERRPLGIPAVIDRIVQTALRNVIEPIFENEFDGSSYGFRPGLGCHDALSEVERLLASGNVHVVDVDIRKYFDSIPFAPLMAEVAKRIADGKVLGLVESYLRQGVLEDLKLWNPATGTPQGAVISPLLANVYLHPVDVAMKQAGYRLVRYADDMVVLCRSREEAEAALAKLHELLEERQLQLHPEKTRLAHLMERPGFQFLGYVFYDRFRDPRPSSEEKLFNTLRRKTKLNNGQSMAEIVQSLNATLRGWYNYFKFGSENSFVWSKVDKRVRYRLRAILDRRTNRGKKAARGRGLAHVKWPNDYFTELGLFSLVSAPKLVRQL